jgi:hypothetical protein
MEVNTMKDEMIKMFIAEKEKEFGKAVEAIKAGTLIVYHTVDRAIAGYESYDNWVEAHR